MAAWPSSPTLPAWTDIMAGSFRETPGNNIIRTEMEVGPAKVRKRSTTAPDIISGNLYMTQAQIANFRTFFKTTVNYGADSFTAVHPDTAAAITARFVGQPQITSYGKEFILTIVAEVLP